MKGSCIQEKNHFIAFLGWSNALFLTEVKTTLKLFLCWNGVASEVRKTKSTSAEFIDVFEFRKGFMIHYLHRMTNQVAQGLVAGVCALVLMGVALFGSVSSAFAATGGSVAETMDLKMDKAAQEFVSAILGEYEDALEDSFNGTLKPLKSVTKDLTKQLSKIAISPTPDTTTLEPKLMASQTALETAAAAFSTLVDDTAAFKTTLSTSPERLKETLATQIGTKFDDLQAAFDGVAKALSSLSEDTAAVDEADVTAAVGKLTEDSTSLAQAIELAKTAISSFGD